MARALEAARDNAAADCLSVAEPELSPAPLDPPRFSEPSTLLLVAIGLAGMLLGRLVPSMMGEHAGGF